MRRWCRTATKAAPQGAPCWRPLEAAQHGGRDTADHGHERGLTARALDGLAESLAPRPGARLGVLGLRRRGALRLLGRRGGELLLVASALARRASDLDEIDGGDAGEGAARCGRGLAHGRARRHLLLLLLLLRVLSGRRGALQEAPRAVGRERSTLHRRERRVSVALRRQLAQQLARRLRDGTARPVARPAVGGCEA